MARSSQSEDEIPSVTIGIGAGSRTVHGSRCSKSWYESRFCGRPLATSFLFGQTRSSDSAILALVLSTTPVNFESK